MFKSSTRIMMLLSWRSLIYILAVFLVYDCPESNGKTRRDELLLLGMHNHNYTAIAMDLWGEDYKHYCWLCAVHLQGTQCPFMKLLLRSLLALPVYNLMLILIGWHLNKSSSSSAERIVLVLQPVMQRAAPDPPLVASVPPSSVQPPAPPPRFKRRLAPKPPVRLAPKPPPRRLRSTHIIAETYSSQNPIASLQRCRNLRRALEGLQQPLPPPLPVSIPLPMPISTINSNNLVEDSTPVPAATSKQTTSKVKSRKLLHTLLKRLGKRFAKRSCEPQEQAADLTGSNMNSSNGSSVHQPIWQRLRFRKSRKLTSDWALTSSSSNSVSSNCSSGCLYVY